MIERLFATDKIKKKLKEKHGLDWSEVLGVWQSFNGTTLEDDREEHRTDPPTQWFVHKGIKIVFLEQVAVPNVCILKSAFAANEKEKQLYSKYGVSYE